MPSEQAATVDVEVAIKRSRQELDSRLGLKLYEALGLPPATKKFTLTVDWSQAPCPLVEVVCESLVTNEQGQAVVKVIKEAKCSPSN